jgi:succinate dehydrogenase/fumarate reductase flavoprotein subunit
VEASAFIRECSERDQGIKTPAGRAGIWLDSPIIDILSGPGTIQKNLPAMVRQYLRFDIDIKKYPMLVYPTLHYQNGGIEINENGETTIPNLYAAGETSGGLHGRNRLMGNSVLDYNVFGRRAALNAVEKAKSVKLGKLHFDHVRKYERELKETGIETKRIAPILLPDYRNFEVIRKHRKEFDPFLGGGVTGWYEEE